MLSEAVRHCLPYMQGQPEVFGRSKTCRCDEL